MAAEGRDVSGVVLVTGGARGIGFEVVRQPAQRGMTVIPGARDREKGESTLPEDGPIGSVFRDAEPLPW